MFNTFSVDLFLDEYRLYIYIMLYVKQTWSLSSMLTSGYHKHSIQAAVHWLPSVFNTVTLYFSKQISDRFNLMT